MKCHGEKKKMKGAKAYWDGGGLGREQCCHLYKGHSQGKPHQKAAFEGRLEGTNLRGWGGSYEDIRGECHEQRRLQM